MSNLKQIAIQLLHARKVKELEGKSEKYRNLKLGLWQELAHELQVNCYCESCLVPICDGDECFQWSDGPVTCKECGGPND